MVGNRFFEDAPAANDRNTPFRIEAQARGAAESFVSGIATAKPTGENTYEGVSMSVIVTVPIPDDLVARLEQKARTAGMERDQYVRDIVSRDLESSRPLDEILRSFRDEAAASGMTDADLLNVFHDARAASRASGQP